MLGLNCNGANDVFPNLGNLVSLIEVISKGKGYFEDALYHNFSEMKIMAILK